MTRTRAGPDDRAALTGPISTSSPTSISSGTNPSRRSKDPKPRGTTTGVRRSMSRSDGTSRWSRCACEMSTASRSRRTAGGGHGAAPDQHADPPPQQRVGEQPDAVHLEEHRRVPRERQRERGRRRVRAHTATLPETATIIGASPSPHHATVVGTIMGRNSFQRPHDDAVGLLNRSWTSTPAPGRRTSAPRGAQERGGGRRQPPAPSAFCSPSTNTSTSCGSNWEPAPARSSAMARCRRERQGGTDGRSPWPARRRRWRSPAPRTGSPLPAARRGTLAVPAFVVVQDHRGERVEDIVLSSSRIPISGCRRMVDCSPAVNSPRRLSSSTGMPTLPMS